MNGKEVAESVRSESPLCPFCLCPACPIPRVNWRQSLLERPWSRSPSIRDAAELTSRIPIVAHEEITRVDCCGIAAVEGSNVELRCNDRGAVVDTGSGRCPTPTRVQVQVNKGNHNCRMQWVSVPGHQLHSTLWRIRRREGQSASHLEHRTAIAHG